ncbi:MAG: hypothetical protein OXI59_02560 [Gemmatimonadota bacterium]|nr:hypothetical protein [Gemmatimonadota bacterium]
MISEMRQHFEEHGWVRLEGVLDRKKINAYKSTLDRIASGIWSLTGNDVTTTRIDTLILRDVLGEWRGKLDQCYRKPYMYNFEDV